MANQLSSLVLTVVVCLIHFLNRNDNIQFIDQASLVIYSDYQSASCRESSRWIQQLRRQYSGGLRIVIKHFPLPDHPRSFLAARAAFCASGYGRFWEYHDRLFAVSDLTEPMLLKYAVEIGLDEFDFEQCLESDTSRDAVTKDREEALTLKLSSLPAFILDGRILFGVRSLADLMRQVRSARSGKS
jgi:protein-disulfide isomerase